MVRSGCRSSNMGASDVQVGLGGRAGWARRSVRHAPLGFVPLAALAVLFLALPVVGLVVRAPWRELPADLAAPGVLTALRLSLSARRAPWPYRAWSACRSPGCSPGCRFRDAGWCARSSSCRWCCRPWWAASRCCWPSVATAWSGSGSIGPFGITLPFTTTATIMAETFVAMPFLVITVEAGLRSLGQRYEDAAATLGAGRWTTFRRVTLPLIAPSLGAGAALCWARALGESVRPSPSPATCRAARRPCRSPSMWRCRTTWAAQSP